MLMLMLISTEHGHMLKLILEIIISPEQAMSSHTVDVPCIGKTLWKKKLLLALVKQNILLFPCVAALSFHSDDL